MGLKTKVVVLTGQIGCGKSTVAVQLSRLGYNVCDADDLVRYLQEPGQRVLRRIGARFPGSVMGGALNR